MSLNSVFIPILLMGLIIAITRFLPFVIFRKKEPSKIIQFIANYLPPLVLAVLVVYCIKDINFTSTPYGLPQIIAIVFCAITYIWKNNSLFSIFGGLAIFMVLQYVI